MAEQESNFIDKGPCEACGSSDACARYDDGHTYCFSCGAYTHGDGESGARTAPEVEGDLVRGEYKDLVKRGIGVATCKKFGYQIARRAGVAVQVAPYRDKSGNKIVAQKLRYPDKEMPWVGKAKKVGQLFGQHLWPQGGRRVVVTEGEVDAMTISHLQSDKWPVVSIWGGASNAASNAAAVATWLESFDEIVLFFDMDEPGREAAIEVAQVLRPGKVKIVELGGGFKDASEAHVAGRGDMVLKAIWDARPYRPDGIRAVDDLLDAACKPVEWGLPWPWQSLTEATYGIRPGEIYAFGGGVGCGKTEVFKEIVQHIAVVQGLPVGVIFLEEPPAHTLKVLAGKVANKRFHVPGLSFTREEIAEAAAPLNGKVHFYDHFGAKDWPAVRSQIRFMAQGMGIKHILLDHLTALIAGEDDERRALDRIMQEMASDALAWGCTIYFISHLTTPNGTPHEEGGRVLEKHFTGSRAIARWSHFMFGIERNKQEPDQPTTFRILKDRYTGDGNGVTFGLMWDRERGRLVECTLPEDGEEAAPRYDLTGADSDY
jgi:twinkle protein